MPQPRGTPHRRPANEVGHAHELTFSCYRRYPFLSAERTCRWLVQAIEDARLTLDFALWAFVFMPDHVHMIVRPRRPGCRVSEILRAVKGPVGRSALGFIEENRPDWLARVTRRRGDRSEKLFWQSGGGFDRNVWEPRTLISMVDYIHANPVRQGLAERPRDWPWSSAGWFEGVPGCDLIPDPIPPEWIPQD
ncbi:MAG: transposase [Isosphaeraceae bacterium]